MEDACRRDTQFEHGLSCDAQQSFGTTLAPILCVQKCRRAENDTRLSNLLLFSCKQKEATITSWKIFDEAPWFTTGMPMFCFVL